MKLLALLLLPTSLPVYVSRSSSHHHHHHRLHMPLISSMSSNLVGSIIPPNPIFCNPKPHNHRHHHKRKLPTFTTMAPCIHSGRTEPRTNPTTLDDRVYDYVKYCRQSLPDLVSCTPFSATSTTTTQKRSFSKKCGGDEDLWLKMKEEARSDVQQEPILSNYYFNWILAHDSMESALAAILSLKLSDNSLPNGTLHDLFLDILSKDGEIMQAVADDLRAVKERDAACISFVQCFLNFKGFLACQSHRIAHKLWTNGRKVLALVIQNRVSEVFAVDIHPGAKIGRGILVDHATGVVVGETAVIGDNVSLLHNVTLGGTGKVSGDRHPKIGDGVLIGAGTCVLGNVRIGDGAKIGAGSVVLKEVPPRTTAVGNPAKLIGGKENPVKLDKIPSLTMDHTSHISEWSDYVI